MNYAYTPHIWPSFLTVLLLIVLAVLAWQHRSVPGALQFQIACQFATIWAVGSVMEYAALDVATKIFWVKFQGAFQMPYTTAITCFFLEYAWPGRWLTRRNLVLLSIFPLLALGVILTDDIHHLMWLGFTFEQSSSLYGLIIPQIAPLGWLLIAYAYGLGVLNILVSAWLFIHSPQHRLPVVIMLTGLVTGRVVYLLEKTHILQVDLPLDVLAIGCTYLLYAIALFGFRLFDPVVLASRTVIAQMHEGMLVFDRQGQVASLNPAAERIFGLPAGRLRGQSARDLNSAFAGWLEGPLGDAEADEGELSLETGQEVRHYLYEVSPLNDWRGRVVVGRLVLLHDVTERRRAETALREAEEIRRLIFENASDGVAIYEEFPEKGERRLLECNERYAQMAGRSREELLEIGDTLRVQKVLVPDPNAKPRREIGEAQYEGSFSWVRPDGRENIIEYNAATIRVGGRLLTIGTDRDVTERMQAEAQIVEQQRALAMLREREQLARELHDSLGQVLGYTGLRMEVVRTLIAGGKLDSADDHLVQLEDIVADAHADVREYILNLRSAPTGQLPFFAALQHYLDGFLKNYGIRVDLSMGAGVEEGMFTPEAQMQLFRIIQEAFSNARKHAQADCVRLSFAVHDGLIRIRIQDNGRGFDPARAAGEGHFGLRIMRERAEALGGSLRVDSAPGQGTCVEVQIPGNLSQSRQERKEI